MLQPIDRGQRDPESSDRRFEEPHDAMGFVATTGTRGRIVDAARYFRLSLGSAEVAFVVEDACQHHGVGRRLLHRLVRAAREEGITELVAEILAENTRMLHLLQEARPTTVECKGGVCEVRVDLHKGAASYWYSRPPSGLARHGSCGENLRPCRMRTCRGVISRGDLFKRAEILWE